LIPSIFHRTKVNIFQNFAAIEILKDGSKSAKLLDMDDILRYNSKKKIPLRDLRILSRLESRGQCSILPRPQSNCIIMEIENLRLICWKDRCILIQQASKIHEAFLAEITSSVSDGSKRTEELNNVLRLYQNSEEVEEVGFEHLVLESALSVTVAKYERHIQIFRPAVDLLLQQIAADPNSSMLRRLLAVKKSLSDFELNVINVSKIIQNLLGNDEDMVGLYLTNMERRVDQHEEVELLLESYLADLDDIQQQIRIIKETIEDTNQFIGAHLDTTRNRVITGLMLKKIDLCPPLLKSR